MEHQIIINKDGRTDFSHLGIQGLTVDRIELHGEGKLSHCILTFCEEDVLGLQKDLLFLKPLHQESQILFPYVRDFTMTGYAFCVILILTGNVSGEGDIVLYLSPGHKA